MKIAFCNLSKQNVPRLTESFEGTTPPLTFLFSSVTV